MQFSYLTNVPQGLKRLLVDYIRKYGVEPDMAMYGKALGNGCAITATIGKKVS